MNSLSWMIYAADVAGGANALFGVTMTVAVVSVPVLLVMNQWQRDFGDDEKIVKVPYAKVLAVVALAVLLSVFTPTPSTIYAIAASEMGEDVLTSETGGKAMQALDAWLDRQIADEEPTQ